MEESAALDDLQQFIGMWHMTASFADAPQAITTFEWLPGRRFLIQRWEVEHPDAPDGIAIIGIDSTNGTLVSTTSILVGSHASTRWDSPMAYGRFSG